MALWEFFPAPYIGEPTTLFMTDLPTVTSGKTPKFITTALICLLALSVSGQDPYIDSLKTDLQKQQTDTGRLKTLSELVFTYAGSDLSVANQYAEQQLELARKIDIPVFLANAYNDLAIVRFYDGKADEALRLNLTAYGIRKKLGNPKLEISSLNKIAIIYQDRNVMDTAAQYHFRILKLAEQLKDSNTIGITYNNLAFLFLNLKQTKRAMGYAYQAKALLAAYSSDLDRAKNFGNLGQAHDDFRDYDSATYYYKKAEALFEKSNFLSGLASVYNNLGIIERKRGNDAGAEAAYRKAYDVAGALQSESDQAFYAGNLASVMVARNKPAEAYPFMQQARIFGERERHYDILKMAYSALENYHIKMGHIDTADHYKELMLNTIDSVYAGVNRKQLNDLEKRYETEKKEQQISLLNKENTIQRLTINRNYLYLVMAAGLLLTTVAVSYLLYNRRKLKDKQRLQAEILHQQEVATKAIIEAEENERNRIARDLHDGVGQMMSVARMNLSLLQDAEQGNNECQLVLDKAVALVDESCREVRQVSHNLTPNALLKNGLASAIRTFVDQVQTDKLKVHLYTEHLNENLDKNTEVVLYRVIQESVNNVVKHAHASVLDISIVNDEAGLQATIEDNGRGFDMAHLSNDAGIGLDNMKKRVAFLKGEIEWSSRPGEGTLVSIHIPGKTGL